MDGVGCRWLPRVRLGTCVRQELGLRPQLQGGPISSLTQPLGAGAPGEWGPKPRQALSPTPTCFPSLSELGGKTAVSSVGPGPNENVVSLFDSRA